MQISHSLTRRAIWLFSKQRSHELTIVFLWLMILKRLGLCVCISSKFNMKKGMVISMYYSEIKTECLYAQ